MKPDSTNQESKKPRVSVVVPSYNHARFIAAALESVVEQSFKDYEMIIIDDLSSDMSVDEIRKFIARHPEIPIRFLCHEKNMGGVLTLNELIENASGEYIALINSDDVWLPNKLEQQVNYLDTHAEVGAVFTQALIVDQDGLIVTEFGDFPADIFVQKNRSRGMWLRRFFFELNCLCHPSILIRKTVYQSIGLYDPRFRQLPDMHMWVRLLKITDIHILEEPLVHLRFHTSNTSKVSIETSIRNMNELSLILTEFFDGITDEVMVEGFADLFRNKNAVSSEEIACEKGFIYFIPDFSFKSLYHHIGVKRLYDLLGNPTSCAVLKDRYAFDYNTFFTLSGTKFFDGDLVSVISNMEEAASGKQGIFTFLKYMFAKDRHYLAVYLMRKYPRFHKKLLGVWVRLKGKQK
jgi:glycosyltransferase involved in cell wall biosynthesis